MENKQFGPNNDVLTGPLDARMKYLEEFHHIPPPLASAIVCHAEVTHHCAIRAARTGGDVDEVKMITQAYLGVWINVGALLGGIGTPMGLNQKRVMDAALRCFERTVKENIALEEKLENDPAFARRYQEQCAGAEMERVISKLMDK